MRRAIGKLFQRTFRFWEMFGIHITPDHFFYPIPSTSNLREELFERQSECIGVDWNLQVQKHYLREIFPRFCRERTFKQNPGLSLVDAAILHAMIRYHRPRKMIEIGNGASTRIAAEACLMNQQEGVPCQFTGIDPFPGEELVKGFPGLTRLIKQKVEAVSLEEFVDCDLLFIDSSHVVKIGGDVNHEQLEILPRVKRGCLIHFHDILLPGEYWKDWVTEKHYFWSEQYLLWAFLLFNNAFEIVWASRYMHLRDPAAIKREFPYFDPEHHRITSFWIRRRN